MGNKSNSYLSQTTSFSRWYDKSFSLIVSKNGTSAINFEHAWGDGVAVLRFFNEVFKDTTTRPAITEETAKSVNSESTVRKLEFSLTSEIERGIRLAQEKFDNAVGKLHTEVMEITSFGKEFIKTKKLSPDALFQLAFQVRSVQIEVEPRLIDHRTSKSAA